MKNPELELVTVATFSNSIEAQLAKTKLESDGIEVFTANEHIVSINWLFSGAVGGIKIQVRKRDEPQAKEILTETYKAIEDERTEEEDAVKCPQCNSANTTFEKFSKRIAFVSWLVLNFPIPFFKKEWRCRDCGFMWK